MLHPAPSDKNIAAINGTHPIYLKCFYCRGIKAAITWVSTENLKYSHITSKKRTQKNMPEPIMVFLQQATQELTDCETKFSQ